MIFTADMIKLLIVLSSCTLLCAGAPTILSGFQHMGCYLDDIAARDINGKEVNPALLTVATCTESCRTDGYPFAGLQDGQRCFCGQKYGTYGYTPSCNYTCEDDTVLCGGPSANDVYYTVQQEENLAKPRRFTLHPERLTFIEARKTCIKNGGDLAAVMTKADLNLTLSLLQQLPAKDTKSDDDSAGLDRIWFGLWRQPSPSVKWVWNNSTLGELDLLDPEYANRWKSGEQHLQDCAAILVSQQKWETISCSGGFPFVCNEVYDENANAGDDDSATEDVEEEPMIISDVITYFVVLPIFLFCYGGACVVYCIGKLCRYCRRRKRRAMFMANMAEFEPDTKPLQPKKSPMAPPPYGAKPMPPPPKKKADVELKHHAAKMKDEAMRNEMLDNALKEARERRKKEKEAGKVNPNKAPKPYSPTPNLPASAEKYKKSDTPDPELPIDPQNLSIQEILRIKALVKEQRQAKRAKKILQA